MPMSAGAPHSRNRLLALEPRLLFDGAVAAGADMAIAGPDPAGVVLDGRARMGLDGRGAAVGREALADADLLLQTGCPQDVDPGITVTLDKGAFTDPAARAAAIAAGGDALADADVDGVDAGDTVHFAIRISNTGERAVFDLQLTDRLPPGFEAADVYDLQVVDGDGQRLDVSAGNLLRNASTGAIIRNDAAFAEALFGGDGVEFIDPGRGLLGTAGQPQARDAGSAIVAKTYDSDHSRSVLVLYSIDLPGCVVAADTVENRAEVIHASDRDCGPDRLPADDRPADEARITIRGAQLMTALIATDQSHTGGHDAVIGEILTYQTRITVPEGISPQAVLTQRMDAGLALVAIDRIDADDGIRYQPVDLADIRPDDVGDGVANRFAIDFGTIINGNRDNARPDTIVVTWRAVVTNILANQSGELRQTEAGYRSLGGDCPPPCAADDVAPADCAARVDLVATAEPVRVVEPVLSVAVTPDGGMVTAGGQATFLVTIRNDGDVDAFDLTMDPVRLPDGLQAADGPWQAPPLPVLAAGESVTLSFTAAVAADLPAGQGLPVDVVVRYTSLPDVAGAGPQQPAVADSMDRSPFVDGIDQERTGADGPGGLNDYLSADPGAIVVAAPTPPPVTPPPVTPEPPGPVAPPPVPGPGGPPPGPSGPSGPSGPPAGPAEPVPVQPPPPEPGPADEPLGPAATPLSPLAAGPLDALFRPDTVPPGLEPPVLFQVDAPAAVAEKPVAPEDDCVPDKPVPAAAPVVRPRATVLKPALRPDKPPAASEPRVPLKRRFVPPPIVKQPVQC